MKAETDETKVTEEGSSSQHSTLPNPQVTHMSLWEPTPHSCPVPSPCFSLLERLQGG